MHRLVRFSLAGALALAAGALCAAEFPAPGEEAFVRINRVRAFAPEAIDSVVLREARTQYRRVITEGPCPGIQEANRIGFAIGSLTYTYVHGRGGQLIPVIDRSIINRVSGKTPHARLVLVDNDKDVRMQCHIKRVEAIDEETFNDAVEAAGVRDNRWGGDRL